MDFITQLWIPILVSAAAVWVASAVAWMAIQHHNKDMQTLPDEKGYIAAIKSMGIKPGVYGYPNMQSCKGMSAEDKKRMMTEPMGILRVWKVDGSMGGPMIATFVVQLVVSLLIAYLGWEALGPGRSFEKVFQVLGTAGILAYCFGGVCGSIWFQESRRAMVLNFIDGVVYGLVTGAVFAWLWPKVAVVAMAV